ncbi:MAG: NAD(+) synthase [Bacillota bacterium]|nr:NAD(+) synthase [Bacillota bacterium]
MKSWAQGEAERIQRWLIRKVEEAGARGGVLGLSGGLDSAVVGALAARAWPGRAWALVLPCHSDPQLVAAAKDLGTALGLQVVTFDLSTVYDVFTATLARPEDRRLEAGVSRLREANLKPRLRMAALYHVAAGRQALVLGTSNRSERFIGYFTKWGDGGADLLPIGHLLKREVRELGRFLGVPEAILKKPPSADLWPGQTDEGELGFTYDDLDAYIAGDRDGLSPEVRRMIEERHRMTAHKRSMPPDPGEEEEKHGGTFQMA